MNGTFIFRQEWLTYIEDLSIDEQNKVIRSVIDYSFSEDKDYMPELSLAGMVAFKCIRMSIDRATDKYEQSCSNGRKGGAPKGNANAKKQPKTTQNNPPLFKNNPQVDSENNQNNLPYPYPYPLPNPYPNPSYYSSCEDDEEEQQQEVLECFFFLKNYRKAETETEKFLAYNNLGDRNWSKMSQKEKESALQLWTQKPTQKPRFPLDQLNAWGEIYRIVKENAPKDIYLLMMADCIKWKCDKHDLIIDIPFALYTYIETNRDMLKPTFMEMLRTCDCTKIKYNIIK